MSSEVCELLCRHTSTVLLYLTVFNIYIVLCGFRVKMFFLLWTGLIGRMRRRLANMFLRALSLSTKILWVCNSFRVEIWLNTKSFCLMELENGIDVLYPFFLLHPAKKEQIENLCLFGWEMIPSIPFMYKMYIKIKICFINSL